MTAPNHLTGGIVFTGLFCSFFSVNIFASPLFISVTLIGSLLPDIDHTKSWIGKTFYPIAKWLSVNYGHRTITHSVFFLIGICILSIFIEKNFSDNYSISIILFFSVFSHLLFDMVTLQGIPLLYPFYKNPCVLPANPEMRIRSGNIRQEGIILFIFCFLTFFMQDLFANGFWSTVNNNFNDIKHQIKEYKKSPNALKIDYDYNVYQTNFKGTGNLIYATESEVFILANDKMHILKENEQGLKINTLKTQKTDCLVIQEKIELKDCSESKLNMLLKNSFVKKAIVYSNYESTISTNQLEFKKKFEFENKFNIQFKSHFLDTIAVNKAKKINELELKIKNEENQLINDNKEFYTTQNLLKQEKNKLNLDLPDYELNETQKNIIELENKLSHHHLKTNLMISEYKNRLTKIKETPIQDVLYFGEITFITITK